MADSQVKGMIAGISVRLREIMCDCGEQCAIAGNRSLKDCTEATVQADVRTAAGYFEFDASPVRFLRGGYTGTMSRRDEVLVKHRKAIVAAAKRNKARTIALVGSVARGEDTEDSDYDFLVEFEKGITLFGIGRLEVALEDLLGCSVDVVPRALLRGSCSGMVEDAILL